MRDQHFWPQVHALVPDQIEYTNLTRLDQVGSLLACLGRHAPTLERSLPRTNEGLDIDHRRCYDTATATIVERLYQADFDRLGYDKKPPVASAGPMVLGPVAQRLVDAVHRRNRRIAMIRRGVGPRWELVRQRHVLRTRLRWLRNYWTR